jgi:adenylate kinase family enzyme
MVAHVHILGASGSGTSTLGEALARSFGHVHLDTDDYFWEPTTPPFQQIRERQRRQALLSAALDAHPRWVLSGSLCGWGDIFIPRFDLVIFLVVPQEIRMARLKAREERRFGREALAPGGAMHEAHVAFMNWAAGYDEGGDDIRSRRRHEQWLAALPCPCIRLEGLLTVAEQLIQLEEVLAGGEVGFNPGAI